MAAKDQDPMTASTKDAAADALGNVSSPERAAGQVDDAGWPKPGDEGYVHPDGTPQSVAQLASNRQAAADRAAAGSIVHGAPSVQRGGRPDATNIAVDRARAAGSASNEDRDAALTKFVRDGQAELAERVDEAAAADMGDAAPADRNELVTPTAGVGGSKADESSSTSRSRTGAKA